MARHEAEASETGYQTNKTEQDFVPGYADLLKQHLASLRVGERLTNLPRSAVSAVKDGYWITKDILTHSASALTIAPLITIAGAAVVMATSINQEDEKLHKALSATTTRTSTATVTSTAEPSVTPRPTRTRISYKPTAPSEDPEQASGGRNGPLPANATPSIQERQATVAALAAVYPTSTRTP